MSTIDTGLTKDKLKNRFTRRCAEEKNSRATDDLIGVRFYYDFSYPPCTTKFKSAEKFKDASIVDEFLFDAMKDKTSFAGFFNLGNLFDEFFDCV